MAEYRISGSCPKTCEQIKSEIAQKLYEIQELQRDMKESEKLEAKHLMGWSIPETAILGENDEEVSRACLNRVDPLFQKISNGIAITREEAVTLTENVLIMFCTVRDQIQRWNIFSFAKHALAQIYAQLPSVIHIDKGGEE